MHADACPLKCAVVLSPLEEDRPLDGRLSPPESPPPNFLDAQFDAQFVDGEVYVESDAEPEGEARPSGPVSLKDPESWLIE